LNNNNVIFIFCKENLKISYLSYFKIIL